MFQRSLVLFVSAAVGLASCQVEAKTWAWDEILEAAQLDHYYEQSHHMAQNKVVALQAQQQLSQWGGDWSVQTDAIPLEQTAFHLTNTLKWTSQSGVESRIQFKDNESFHWSVTWPWQSRHDYQKQRQDGRLQKRANHVAQQQAFSTHILHLLQQYAQWWSAHQQYGVAEEKQAMLVSAHQAQLERWSQGRISEHELNQSQWDVDNGAMTLNWAWEKRDNARQDLAKALGEDILSQGDEPTLNIAQLPMLMPFEYYEGYGAQHAFLWILQEIEMEAWQLKTQGLKAQQSLPVTVLAKGNQNYSELGVQMTWSFKDRKKHQQAVELETAQKTLMDHRHEEQSTQLSTDIANHWQSAYQKKVALKQIEQQLTLAKKNLEEVLLLIEMGRKSSSERQVALMNWSDSQQVFLEASMDYFMHWANLMHAIGGLNEQWLYQIWDHAQCIDAD